jgi:Thioredoxin
MQRSIYQKNTCNGLAALESSNQMVRPIPVHPCLTGSVCMGTTTSVVTPSRFASGLTYADFLAQVTVNRDRFEKNYANPVVTEHDLQFFRKVAALPDGPRKLLAIGEAWCGDVYRELPTVARIAEAAGLELRIFLRDENPDIMDEFLSNNGKSRAIPIFAFYTAETKYIAHFTERSATAHAGLAQAMKDARTKLGLPDTATFGNLVDPERQKFLLEVIARTEPLAGQWRKDGVKEIRQLLANALHISEGA